MGRERSLAGRRGPGHAGPILHPARPRGILARSFLHSSQNRNLGTRLGAYEGVPNFICLLGIVLLTVAPLRAHDGLSEARRAQALLGPEIWSRVLRLENDARGGRYPRLVYALVFELADVLWFYTATEGTRSFSLHRGRLAEEKADFGPLLHDIEPGFARWSIARDEGGAPALMAGELRNGCFIQSVAELRRRLAQGEPMKRPSLLSYYVDTAEGRRGHTVLTFEAGGRLEVIDPERPKKPQRFAADLADNALGLARLMEGDRIVAARWVPMALSVLPGGPILAGTQAVAASRNVL